MYELNSVEAYDYHEDRWSHFPSMLLPREKHSAFSIGNKMFMIGGGYDDVEVFNYFEVFDSVTRKFTSIRSLPKWINYSSPNKIVCVGYKIYLFLETKLMK